MKTKAKTRITIIGGGLAGCECAYALASRGYAVKLYEMKPQKFSAAHTMPTLAELVCSNSLKSESKENASGLLKAELGEFGSLILSTAEESRVPAGSALAVDREKFSKMIDEKIRSMKNIEIISKEISDINIPSDEYLVVATGPLTSDSLARSIAKMLGEDSLFFFDASAPIIDGSTIDHKSAFVQDRYGEYGEGDYLNCPLDKQEYEVFYSELIKGKTVDLKDFEDKKVFEGCMPIEVMAKRGKDSLRFGPLKPVGLFDKRKESRPYAVVQLRKENLEADMYNMVGFQTNLTFGEQKRIFSLIPALRNAEFERYGVMHKNTFICSPKHLTSGFALRNQPNIYFAGQLAGVEGYVESTASGLLSALDIIAKTQNIDYNLSTNTMLGSLASYISNPANAVGFQPINANYGIISPLSEPSRDKKKNRQEIFIRSMSEIKTQKEKFL